MAGVIHNETNSSRVTKCWSRTLRKCKNRTSKTHLLLLAYFYKWREQLAYMWLAVQYPWGIEGQREAKEMVVHFRRPTTLHCSVAPQW